MSEIEMERRIEATITSRIEAGTWYSPALNRLRHMNDAELDVDAGKRADQFLREQKVDCQCYPHGFVSTPRAIKERMKADHIAAGEHEGWCPMGSYVNPLYSRSGDTIQPSYTRRQQRQDEDAEALEYHPQRRFGED